MNAIDIRNVTVHYRDVLALDSATLTLRTGRVCGLVGTNGSGKSTLFKSIMGIVKPDAGVITINGGSPESARKKSAVSYVPQSEDVDWNFPVSVEDIVMMGRYGSQNWLRRRRPQDHAAVHEALERVNLVDLRHRQIGQLSGGQRKRVFVARAIAQNASILLLDEPFTGVDKTTEAMITQLLRELAADGKSVLVSTHDLHSLPTLCDEAVLLHRRVLLQGAPEEVLQPENLALAFGSNPLAHTARYHAPTRPALQKAASGWT